MVKFVNNFNIIKILNSWDNIIHRKYYWATISFSIIYKEIYTFGPRKYFKDFKPCIKANSFLFLDSYNFTRFLFKISITTSL